ncbi:hypothetical protein MPSEU_000307000 [Mayamaea pseudoterrestris]|nr:hypothetical protein MPSEU_000307000 [Mayamaea pseudoterrestris]
MSDEFFNDFSDSKSAGAGATRAKAPPPPPPHRVTPAQQQQQQPPQAPRQPSSSLAAAASRATVQSHSAAAASDTKLSAAAPTPASATTTTRSVTATGPRPMGTNAPATTSVRTNRHQMMQTRPARATATNRSSTRLPQPTGAAAAATAPTPIGFYQPSQQQQQQQQHEANKFSSVQPQPAIFTPSDPSASRYNGIVNAGTGASSSSQLQAAPTQAPAFADAAATNSNFYSQTQPFQQQQYAQPATAASTSYNVNSTFENNNDFSGWMSTSATANTASSLFAGSMDAATTTPAYFTPQLTAANTASSSYYNNNDFLDEPPLLEELGINMSHIFFKTKAVVLPFARLPFLKTNSLSQPTGYTETTSSMMQDSDLAGPLVFALLLGAELLLTGKLHSFGYIYGLSVFGCGALALVLNLMKGSLGSAYDHVMVQQQHEPVSISIWTTTSILGYALLPVNVLAAIKILFSMLMLQHNATVLLMLRFLGVLTVLWSTVASTRLLEVGCNMRAQRYLMAYPIALLYSAFVLVTIF